ncbi:MAG: hypothetical protein HYV06_01430 [Deltaproteobacteria bacterium]|nr:hypothetical protein [Deltaproteobacteria bacterium]
MTTAGIERLSALVRFSLRSNPARRNILRQASLCLAVLFLSQYPHALHASVLSQECDIDGGPCAKTVGGAYVILDIEPKPVKAMKELTFTVTLKGMKEYEGLRLKLQMPGMFMGNNEVRLARSAGGRYTGKGVVPKCHSGKRVWSATVELPGSTPAEVSFLFNVRY